MFKDEALIFYQAGKGGNGCLSFLREKFMPKGGPDGGDGGDGGSIILRVDVSESSLYPFTRVKEFYAKPGKPGGSNNKAGKDGEDLILKVPQGTLLKNPETHEIFCDLTEEGQEYLLAKGGRGGRGNTRFANSVNQTPRHAEEGEEGQSGSVLLELKLIADIGIIGLPNAGKSTFLASVTKAHPKIAPYPFTTLVPQLGFAELNAEERLLFADIPGLIEGSHRGVGLGDQFLRHIERTRLLLHLVDVSETADKDPVVAYKTIREELKLFSPRLLEKPEIVVATKSDLNPRPENILKLEEACGQKVFVISAVARIQLREILLKLHQRLQQIKAEERQLKASV